MNSYDFIDKLFEMLSDDDDVLVCAATPRRASCPTRRQRLKKGQRLISNSGAASMGYDLPASIGVAAARECQKRVICIAGEGSIQMNMQELPDRGRLHHLPVKIIVLDNGGYLSIRQTQMGFFKGRKIGEELPRERD